MAIRVLHNVLPVAKVVAIAVPLLVAGCSGSGPEGPQLPGLPAGFAYDANAGAARLFFPDREMTDQAGWFTFDEDTHCSVMITTYAGAASRDQVEAAYATMAAKYTYPDYTPLESVPVIDGQPAWGWFERQKVKGVECCLEYTAVIPYEKDDVTYTVEFFAKDPRYRTEEYLVSAVKRFRVVKKGGFRTVQLGAILFLGLAFTMVFRRIGKK